MSIHKFWLFRSFLYKVPGQMVNTLVVNIIEISKTMDALCRSEQGDCMKPKVALYPAQKCLPCNEPGFERQKSISNWRRLVLKFENRIIVKLVPMCLKKLNNATVLNFLIRIRKISSARI